MMKKYINIFILLFVIGCSNDQKGLELNVELVDPFYTNDHLYPKNPRFEFVEVNRYELDLNNNNKLDTIKLREIKDWNDPGDFHQIEIVLDNDSNLVETNFGGWVKFGQNYSVNDELRKMNKLDSDLILVTDFNTDLKILLAFGYVYASEPGLLSIFEANGEDPKVVFNKNFEIHSIDDDLFQGVYEFKENEENEVIVKLINNRLENQ